MPSLTHHSGKFASFWLLPPRVQPKSTTFYQPRKSNMGNFECNMIYLGIPFVDVQNSTRFVFPAWNQKFDFCLCYHYWSWSSHHFHLRTRGARGYGFIDPMGLHLDPMYWCWHCSLGLQWIAQALHSTLSEYIPGKVFILVEAIF